MGRKSHAEYRPHVLLLQRPNHSGICGKSLGVGAYRTGEVCLERAAFSVQRSAFSVQRSAFSVQRSAFSVQRSAFSVQRSAENFKSSLSSVKQNIKIFCTNFRAGAYF